MNTYRFWTLPPTIPEWFGLGPEPVSFSFDGLRYLRIAGYPFPQASFIAAHAGNVWAGADYGVTHYRNGRWEVRSRTPVIA